MKKSFSELDLISSFKFVNKEPILVDVGAHEGSVSKIFAEKDWKVVAFEPEKNNLSEFKRNLSSYDNITLIEKAVTDHDGDHIPFFVSSKHFGIHSLKPFHPTHEKAYEVQTVSLEKVLSRLNIDHITFLKIDIEGADFLALKGLDWEQMKPVLVMVEFMDERSVEYFGYSYHEMAKFLIEKGYDCYVSEWAPIKEYGIKGKKGQHHQWIQIDRYPLKKDNLAWGNLIFVSKNHARSFRIHLYRYLIQRYTQPLYRKVKGKIKNLLK